MPSPIPRLLPPIFSIFDSGLAETANNPLFYLSHDAEPSETDNAIGINIHAGPFSTAPIIAHLTHRLSPLPSRPRRRESNSSDTPKILLHEDRGRQGNALGFRSLFSRIIRGRGYQGLWRFTMRLRDPCWAEMMTDVDFEWRHRFRFLNSAAIPPNAKETPFLNDDFALVAIMSGIGIVMGENETLGGVLTAEEIQASQRPHLKRAALVEKHAREAKEWLATLDLLDDNDRDDEPPHIRRAERVAPWRDLHGSRGTITRGKKGVSGKTKSSKAIPPGDRRQRSLSAPETSSQRRAAEKTLHHDASRRQEWEKRPAVYVPRKRERTANASAATRRTTPLRSSQRSSYGDRDPTSRSVILAQGGTQIE
ncbi:uncharacterized protein CLUP02_04859 [Colletotrichum lupini]|uniref:Uncharacterized protein n=1 Tax=Colletotrichum lupini TaxID=145971 RepID=A0A9Q8SLJ0_9PEZI|nr:uncharacterized protein CLUP02_04859 [Colletotrichum lupini]UQC79380.1 hypothetical protein CLUP02_04859 [Colletotrichum lupini]